MEIKINWHTCFEYNFYKNYKTCFYYCTLTSSQLQPVYIINFLSYSAKV